MLSGVPTGSNWQMTRDVQTKRRDRLLVNFKLQIEAQRHVFQEYCRVCRTTVSFHVAR